MDIKGVIFDLDGTLIHTIEDICDAANAMLANHGIQPHVNEAYLHWIGNGAAKLIERAMGNVIDPARLKQYVAEFKEIYGRNLHHKSRVYEGISEVLDHCLDRDISMTILSNKPHHLTIQVADHHLSAWSFKAVFGQRDHVPRKPDPAAAFEIADIMGIEPGRTLFVGDSQGDMDTAVAAGMIPVGVTWGYGHPKLLNGEKSGRIIHRPSQLIDILSGK